MIFEAVNGDDDVGTLRAVREGKFVFHPHLFNPVSAAAKDFIVKCLTKNVMLRPTASEAQKHSWFRILHDHHEPVSLQVIERLRGFHNRSALSRLCMEVVAHTLCTDQIKELRKEFAKFDVNSSGEISFEHLKLVLLEHGSFIEDDVRKIFADIDVEHTGRVHYHEFIAATVGRNEIKEENVKMAFEKMSNHHDFITASDIRDLLGKDSSAEEVEKMLTDLNFTPDTKINYVQASAGFRHHISSEACSQ